MQVSFYNNPCDFLNKCGTYLKQNEAEHSLILTECQKAEQKTQRGEKDKTRFISLFDGGTFVLAAILAPARNLILSKSSHAGVEKLAEILADKKFSFSSINGVDNTAVVFLNKWSQLTGQKSVAKQQRKSYVLKKALPSPSSVIGELRFVGSENIDIIAAWIPSYFSETLPKAERINREKALERARELVKEGSVAVWVVKGKPVSMATVSEINNAARIKFVYTPPEQRGHGYASAVVANLSRMQLDQGKEICCLSASAQNPVSNSIYEKLGYTLVGHSVFYRLSTILESKSVKALKPAGIRKQVGLI